jgi:hypothetical protein
MSRRENSEQSAVQSRRSQETCYIALQRQISYVLTTATYLQQRQ